MTKKGPSKEDQHLMHLLEMHLQEYDLIKKDLRNLWLVDVQRHPSLEGQDTVPLPLGPLPPPRQKRPKVKEIPDWLEEYVKTNEDPTRGVALGTATERHVFGAERPWNPSVAPPKTVEGAKLTIEQTFG